ncbi:MAG: hypothetical protein AAB676_01905 [Verrucomicrobiota bacterium]
MNSPANHVPSQRMRLVATACGVFSALVGVAVLAGWWFQVPVLKSILPGVVSMKPNTALALVLGGTALALLAGTPVSPRRARTGQWLALLVALIGGLTLGEFLISLTILSEVASNPFAPHLQHYGYRCNKF